MNASQPNEKSASGSQRENKIVVYYHSANRNRIPKLNDILKKAWEKISLNRKDYDKHVSFKQDNTIPHSTPALPVRLESNLGGNLIKNIGDSLYSCRSGYPSCITNTRVTYVGEPPKNVCKCINNKANCKKCASECLVGGCFWLLLNFLFYPEKSHMSNSTTWKRDLTTVGVDFATFN